MWLFSDVWSENSALVKRLMKIHLNPPILMTMTLARNCQDSTYIAKTALLLFFFLLKFFVMKKTSGFLSKMFHDQRSGFASSFFLHYCTYRSIEYFALMSEYSLFSIFFWFTFSAVYRRIFVPLGMKFLLCMTRQNLDFQIDICMPSVHDLSKTFLHPLSSHCKWNFVLLVA